MKRISLFTLCLTLLGAGIAFAFTALAPQIISSFAPESSAETFQKFTAAYVGDWKAYGQPFTNVQVDLFHNIYALIVIFVPIAFLLHYLIIGAKHFSHDGPQVYFFGLFCRFIHWVAAISFTLLVITGLMIIFGKFFGGGQIIRTMRSVHIISAIVSAIAAIPMFLIWVKDMFPAAHDVAWVFIMGGYLSKEKKPVPAGKFNAGQKMWFWLATLGTLLMAYSGYILFAFQGATDQFILMAIIHNVLGALLVAFLIVHFYMSVFAIKGSLASMTSGYKPKEELDILHSRYKIPNN